MVSRAITVSLGAFSAAVGFATAYFVPRAPPPERIVTRVVSVAAPPLRDCPSAPVAPLPAPVVPRAASATTTAPVVPRAAPATAPPRASPLRAFRFVGLGPGGGLQLGRVAPGSLPAALGLRTGDELISVNDFKLADPEQALNAYARLRTASRLELAVRRGGDRTALVYFIR